MGNSVAISVLKREINKLIDRITELTGQISPLVSEKEELETMAREIEESIKKLASSD